MAGEAVYSQNNEDFNWDDPGECLQDMFDNTFEKDWPDVWAVYSGVTTDVELLEPPGSFSVVPTGINHYQMAGMDKYNSPIFITKER